MSQQLKGEILIHFLGCAHVVGGNGKGKKTSILFKKKSFLRLS